LARRVLLHFKNMYIAHTI